MNDIDRALELLHKKGWCKCVSTSLDGRHCLIGALDAVTVNPVVCDLVGDTARALYPERGPTIPRINDHPDTTIEDVELILKHASYEWEQQHHG